MSSDLTVVKAACHCGQLSVSVDVKNSDLPLKVWLCGCDTCRHSSGMLAITCAFLPKGEKKMAVSGKAEKYRTSDGPAALIRCFCGTCGAFVYEDSPDPDRISLYAGALLATDGLVDLAGMTYAADAKDKGMAEWLPGLKIHDQNFSPPPDFTPKPPPPKQSSDDKLHGRCLCGGVQFWITRPDAQSYAIKSFVHPLFAREPAPDSAEASKQVTWWIRDDGRKYAALLCMCNSCRQATGFDIQPWAYIPLHNMVQKDGSPASLKMGTLRKYVSSEGIDRYFCHDCGANVFFVEASRPLLLDVSAGLFDAESGARAEEWLQWCAEASYTEFAQNKPLAEILEKGLHEWHARTGKGVLLT